MKLIVDNAIPFIRDRFPDGIDVTYLPGKEITPDVVKNADALIVRTRTRCDEKLLKGSNVKLVVTATIGTDHIDIPWCEANDIIVKSAPGCNAPGVAQYVFSSLFQAGFNPEKDILGIIGYGNVGSVVADWAGKMGIKTLISDDPRKENGFRDVDYRDMEDVLRNSDAVTLHVPLTKDGKFPTYRLIGNKELEMMKPNAVLVNSSRGGVVDERELKKYLKEKRLKAIVDVWENEPAIDTELARLAAISTPHIAGYSVEGKKRATKMALQAVKDVLDIDINLSGLECLPDNDKEINRETIEKSYNSVKDSKSLLADVSKFEELRTMYNYRHEPLFSE